MLFSPGPRMNAPADKPADEPLEQGFGLGELTVDPNAGEVAGPGGREKLDPKVMDVLVMLARNAGQVVLREDLLARLWPNAVVTDESLSRCIYELRRQLSLAGGDERNKAMRRDGAETRLPVEWRRRTGGSEDRREGRRSIEMAGLGNGRSDHHCGGGLVRREPAPGAGGNSTPRA